MLVVPSVLVLRSSTPVVDATSTITSLGQATPVSVRVQNPRGIRSVAAFIEQNGTRYAIGESLPPAKQTDTKWDFTAGIKTTPQLKDGKATLIVEATSSDLLHKTGRWQREVTVVTQPPSVTADSDQHYLYLGMADLATFTVSGSWTEAGVRVGNQKFRGWPMPGGKPGMFSLYAFAWNMPAGTAPVGLRLKWHRQRGDQSSGRPVSQRKSSQNIRRTICR